MEVSAYLNVNTPLLRVEKLQARMIRTGTGEYRSSCAVMEPERSGESFGKVDSLTYAFLNNEYVHYKRDKGFPPGAGAGFSFISGTGPAAAAASENMPESAPEGGGAVR